MNFGIGNLVSNLDNSTLIGDLESLPSGDRSRLLVSGMELYWTKPYGPGGAQCCRYSCRFGNVDWGCRSMICCDNCQTVGGCCCCNCCDTNDFGCGNIWCSEKLSDACILPACRRNVFDVERMIPGYGEFTNGSSIFSSTIIPPSWRSSHCNAVV